MLSYRVIIKENIILWDEKSYSTVLKSTRARILLLTAVEFAHIWQGSGINNL